VTAPLALFGIVVADGASSGSVASVHPPLLTDSYPTQLRVRILGGYYNFDEHRHLLFSAGRDIDGPIRVQCYLAFQLTF